MGVLTYIVVTQNIYSIPVNNGRDFFEWSHITTKNFDLREVATSSILLAGGVDQVPPRLIEQTDWSLQVLYTCKGCDNIITVENLEIMEQVEMEIFLDKEYKYFCLR